MNRIYKPIDRFFEVGGEEILKNRRVVFVPAIIIFAGIIVVKFSVGPAHQAFATGRDMLTTAEDKPLKIEIPFDLKDKDKRLKITSVTQGKWGNVEINEDGTITYKPNRDFCGIDVFTYTMLNELGQNITRNVRVTVSGTSDCPKIVSTPKTQAEIGSQYTYDVNAADPDPGDKLTYSLIASPEGMTINPTTGLITWSPSDIQIEDQQVTVKVTDISGMDSDFQSFTITMGQTGPSRRAKLTVDKAFGRNDLMDMLGSNSANTIQNSDDDRCQITANSKNCFEFTDATIPVGSKITSVVIYIEHFEDKGFPPDKLLWSIGTGWPINPDIWVSIKAPLKEEARWENTDSWDITTFVDTPEKVNALQLFIENGNEDESKVSFVDCIYVLVEWKQQ